MAVVDSAVHDNATHTMSAQQSGHPEFVKITFHIPQGNSLGRVPASLQICLLKLGSVQPSDWCCTCLPAAVCSLAVCWLYECGASQHTCKHSRMHWEQGAELGMGMSAIIISITSELAT